MLMINYDVTKLVSSGWLKTKQKTIARWRKLLVFCISLMLMATPVFAQQVVTGRITDTKGETIIGASVREKGTSNGTITDLDGNFTLSVLPAATLEISFIGYKTQDVKVVLAGAYRLCWKKPPKRWKK